MMDQKLKSISAKTESTNAASNPDASMMSSDNEYLS
jgi:hypothetical protein